MATLTKAERQEIRARAPMALEAASRLTPRWPLRLDEETGRIVPEEEKQ